MGQRLDVRFPSAGVSAAVCRISNVVALMTTVLEEPYSCANAPLSLLERV